MVVHSKLSQPAVAQQVTVSQLAEIAARLSDKRPEVRRRAAESAAQSAEIGLLDALVGALADTDRVVRRHAAAAIAAIPDESADAAAIAALENPDAAIRRELVRRFKGRSSRAAVEAIKARLHDSDAEVRKQTAKILSENPHADATSALLRVLEHEDGQVRVYATGRLGALPSVEAMPLLIARLRDTDRRVCRRAIHLLYLLPGGSGEKAVLSSLDDPDAQLRRQLVMSIRQDPSAELLPLLLKALNDSDAQVRRVAAEAVRSTLGEAAMRAALAAFSHTDDQVRSQVIARFIEKPHVDALPALVKILAEENSPHSHLAAQAIRKIDDEAARKATVALFDHSDAKVREIAVGRFQDQPDVSMVARLAEKLHDSDATVRRQATVALGRTPGSEAALAMVNALRHSDEKVRLVAVQHFASQPDQRATLPLIELLADESRQVRRQVVQAIGRSATTDQVVSLAPLLHSDDAKLRAVIGAKLKPMIAHARQSAESPLAAEHTIDRMQSLPPIMSDTPAAYVEMFGGDRLVGKVVGHTAENATSGNSEHLLVESRELTAVPREQQTAEHVRIYPHWIRRIVWQPTGANQYRPGVVFLRQGGQIEFRSLRWEADGVAILLADGTQRIAFDEVAELHLPKRDLWTAYCEQLAVLGCEPTDTLLRLDCADGSQVTSNIDRFEAYFYVEPADPDAWQHRLHPAWSVDGLVVLHHQLRLRSRLPGTEVPLFPPSSSPSSDLWPWRVNRNVRGRPLVSGGHPFSSGFGVHADSRLRFELPPYARSFRSSAGLDQSVGNGGCARVIVRLREGEKISELYRSSLLIGSTTIQATGDLKLPAFENMAQLELVADSATNDRPQGADPLNIRDLVNWLEPRLLLDPLGLSAAVAAAAEQLAPDMLQRAKIAK